MHKNIYLFSTHDFIIKLKISPRLASNSMPIPGLKYSASKLPIASTPVHLKPCKGIITDDAISFFLSPNKNTSCWRFIFPLCGSRLSGVYLPAQQQQELRLSSRTSLSRAHCPLLLTSLGAFCPTHLPLPSLPCRCSARPSVATSRSSQRRS